jgi:hypothetical protein
LKLLKLIVGDLLAGLPDQVHPMLGFIGGKCRTKVVDGAQFKMSFINIMEAKGVAKLKVDVSSNRQKYS